MYRIVLVDWSDGVVRGGVDEGSMLRHREQDRRERGE
jgi:hypothetical protein